MGGAIQTITVILLKISGITVVFMVKDCYICSAKKDKQSFTMGAKIVYKSYNQNDSLLFPPALGDLIPENHPVRTVSAVIDRLDITGIESTYKGGGTSSFHPRMLLKVIVYSYMCNVYSGRRMERLLKENVIYMWLSGMSRPDFRTINRFRSERLSDGRFEEVFRQVVLLLNGEGLVSLRVQYIDGTKIESVANRYTFVWKGSVEKNKSKLEAKVAAVLRTAEEVVADSGYGNEQNYAYMEGEGMEAYVKYPMFHAEMKRKYVKNAFLPQNMYYNAERDFYVCPMGQHLERCGTRTSVSDLGYRSVLSVYRAVNCTGCPLRGECYKSKSDRRTIEVNHRVNSFKRQARELLTPDRALAHNLRKYSAMLSGRTAAQSPASATA